VGVVVVVGVVVGVVVVVPVDGVWGIGCVSIKP
jgi:hypothetical protein